MNKLVFLDLETTGLEPDDEEILEAAILIADAETLIQETCGNWPVRHHKYVRRDGYSSRIPTTALIRDQFVLDMHTNNGLIAECDGPDSQTLAVVEQEILKALPEGPAVIAGFSVQFDRSFIKVHMPALYARLHHRIVDVSTFRECSKRWTPEATPEQPKPHRALPDCVAALNELRKYREIMMAGADALASDHK